MPNSMPALRPPTQRTAPSGARRPAKETSASAEPLASQSYFAVTSQRSPRCQRQSSWFPPRTRQDGAALRRPANPRRRRAPAAKRPVLLASVRSGGKNVAVHVSPRLVVQAKPAVPGSRGVVAARRTRRQVVANPSLKPSPNGAPRWPSSAGPSAHFALAVQRATPPVPA